MENILYIAIVLTEESQERLKELARHNMPNDWDENSIKMLCHHMTLCFKPNEDDELFVNFANANKDKKFTLLCERIGHSDKALAVGVHSEDIIPCKNKISHITLAVNQGNGGKPKDSNFITMWNELLKPIKIDGYVRKICP